MDAFSGRDSISLPFLHSQGGNPSILVVEDDAAVREMLVCVLEAEGFNVTEADSAETGLELLADYDFDVVLTDYSLPRGDGTWMLREAAHKGRLAGIPAFIVTAHFDQPFGDDYVV